MIPKPSVPFRMLLVAVLLPRLSIPLQKTNNMSENIVSPSPSCSLLLRTTHHILSDPCRIGDDIQEGYPTNCVKGTTTAMLSGAPGLPEPLSKASCVRAKWPKESQLANNSSGFPDRIIPSCYHNGYQG